MIGPAEVSEHAAQWQVAPAQIHKDHLISHLLAAIADSRLDYWFYGGTALNRSHVRGRRLSEDIDLMVEDVATDIAAPLRRRLLRGVGDTTWDLFSRRTWMYSYRVVTVDAAITVQLVRFDQSDHRWGWEERPVELRYSCLPEVVPMRLPQSEGFVAMKLGAYVDRWAPRDLLDLANLAGVGAINPGALARYRQVTGRSVVLADFDAVRRPTRDLWRTELAHQVEDPGSPEEAADTVRQALVEALQSEGS
jgi:predicted nucleotidyltransferase component of viral defense system